jgi:tetratricopeptide (TPR) repeat protein
MFHPVSMLGRDFPRAITEGIQQMSNTSTEIPFEEGLKALNSGRTGEALDWFAKAVAEEKTPLAVSYLAYCRAKEEGNCKKAIALCMEAIKDEPKNSEIYLNLGRVHLLAGQRKSAIRAFDLGLRYGRSPQIENELALIGRRKSPPLPFLSRSNRLNKFLGKLLKKMGLR